MHIVTLSGSPGSPSRSAWLLTAAERLVAGPGRSVHRIVARDLPALALVRGDAAEPALAEALSQIAAADLVVVATPIYKAAYSGLLKLFLDLLPPDALRGKTVLPLATGGSAGHLLALDYALKPVLAALGARHILDALFAVDTQLVSHPVDGYVADDAVIARLERALDGWRAARPGRAVSAGAAASLQAAVA